MKTRWLAPTLLRAWMLAALLLAAQAAGLAHRLAHAPGLPGSTLAKAAAATAAAAGASHEAGSADCRLIDQLAHADVLCTPAVTLALLPQHADAAALPAQQARAAATPAGYLARAPPQG